MPKQGTGKGHFDSLVHEANKEEKTAEEIKKMMTDYFNKEADNAAKIEKNTKLHDSGGDLSSSEVGVNKVILKMLKRFCKTHASYVLKDMPNIKIKAKNEEVPESNELASFTQKALVLWWKEQGMLRKLKRAVRKASYKGVMAFYLANDPENQTYSFHTLDPEYIAYDRVTDDPDSPLLWFAHGDFINVDILKKAYPKFKGEILPYQSSGFFTLTTNISFFKNTKYENKAFYFEFMDTVYRYKFVNDVMVSKEKHNYPFIPFYLFYYFDLDSEEINSVVDFIAEPAKMINQVFGFRLDFTQKHSDPPLHIRGGSGKKGDIDPRKLNGAIIETQGDGSAQYISPMASSIDAEKMIELVKSFMHFLSGLSEEAMAGFTGSLTAAGVSIELRLDSTVREALDTQIILQDILQKINRDYLKLMEKTYPKKNLMSSSILGVVSDKKFEATKISGLYDNVVDFGGILPRSQSEIVRNAVTKYSTEMLSLDTALAEMNYSDPALEITKLRAEKIANGKLQKQLEQGVTPNEKFFATAEMENAYMFETGEMATPAPDQDHELHISIHESQLDKLGPELKSLFVLHIQMHKKMFEKINEPK